MTSLSTQRVLLLGSSLLVVGMIGFYFIDGMISKDATGSKLVNAFYCSAITLTTVGYGDICPGSDLSIVGRIFIVLFSFTGLGFFCGPLMDLASSSWKDPMQKVIGGQHLALAACVIGAGVLIFTKLEGVSNSEAVYVSIITGTTIGYGDISPSTDIGKIATATYAILVVNVTAILLEPGRDYLERFCYAVKDVQETTAEEEDTNIEKLTAKDIAKKIRSSQKNKKKVKRK